MTVVVQRVTSACVRVDGEAVGKCEQGFLLLAGVAKGDDETDIRLLADKISGLRIMEDENQKMNQSLADVGGGMLVISNFTLCGDYRKGNRPDFFSAADPETAKRLYDLFCRLLKEKNPKTECGVFGADMKIEACCDGPVTLVMDSRVLRKLREP